MTMTPSATESADPRFADIDGWPTRAAVEAMLEGQMAAIASLASQTAAIAAAAEAAAARLAAGGRLIYAGAGTSGRVAVQDGVELGPTFGWPADRLVYVLAGGMAALAHSAEGAEDDGDAARAALADAGVGQPDVVIGVAASGRTPFTLAAIAAGRAAGALTIAVASNAGSPLLEAADHPLLTATGAELVAGSTRMKAGTAQKACLNILSTAIMLRLGGVYRGLMVDMVISNAKLQDRAEAMVATIAGCSPGAAKAALAAAGGRIKAGVLIASGLTADAAAALLAAHGGQLRGALAALTDRGGA